MSKQGFTASLGKPAGKVFKCWCCEEIASTVHPLLCPEHEIELAALLLKTEPSQ